MSSVIFQPLLHDPLGWKSSNSTYTDHYKWRKYRETRKDKKVSAYGQQYQKELQAQQLNQSLNGEQTISRVIVVKKNDENQERPISYRYSPSKTPIYIVEYQQRPVSANNAITSTSKASQRPPTAPPTVEEKARPSSKYEREKTPIDLIQENSRHWLTYPNPRTPDYIIDIKKRLNQLKVPGTLARPASASNASVQQRQQEQQPQTPPAIHRPSSASVSRPQKDDQHHFLTIHTRQTPEDLRVIRHRIDKHRYNPSLDNYPPRPQTCPTRPSPPKPVTPENEVNNTPTPKTNVWIDNEERKATPPGNESTSILVQMVDCDGVPHEYVDALETANAAQREYQRNAIKRPENTVYRLSTTSSENKNEPFIAPSQQSTEMNHQMRQVTRASPNSFGTWVRKATDQERASAMKILNEVLNQPVIGYDNQTKQRTTFKQAPTPTPVRATSATRKLGRTRTQHQFPCEICEKLLIKRHLWDLSGSETYTCPHHPQDIQVRA